MKKRANPTSTRCAYSIVSSQKVERRNEKPSLTQCSFKCQTRHTHSGLAQCRKLFSSLLFFFNSTFARKLKIPPHPHTTLLLPVRALISRRRRRRYDAIRWKANNCCVPMQGTSLRYMQLMEERKRERKKSFFFTVQSSENQVRTLHNYEEEYYEQREREKGEKPLVAWSNDDQ